MKYKGDQVYKAIKDSDDPLKELGPGISSFHWLLTRLFALFVVLYLVHIPVMNIFLDYDEYDDHPSAGYSVHRSLGNMGFARTECDVFPIIKGQQRDLKCASGKITKLVDWGMQSHSDSVNQCRKRSSNICNGVLNDAAFQKFFADSCHDKDFCSIQDLNNYLLKDSLTDKCGKKDSKIFIQYMCKQTKEEIALKLDRASTCIYIAIGSAVFVTLFAVLGKTWTKQLACKYDEKTVTPSDYVLMLRITPDQSAEFDQYHN